MSHSKIKKIYGPPGTGKTTFLLNIVEKELESSLTPEDIGFVAYTKKAASEAISRASYKFKLDQKDFKPLQSFTKDQQKLAVNPQITIDNEMSKQVTTFQILSGDRPGLLMDILGVFHDKQISVQSAKISTYGEKVFDIFQLTNSNNQKIKDTKLLKSIENNLISIL